MSNAEERDQDRRFASTRRQFVAGALGATGLLVAGRGRAAAASPAIIPAAQGGFDWMKYKGTQIRLLANAHPWTESIKPKLGDFEKLTGIKVVEEDLPETQFRQKLTTELSQGTGSVDVMMSAPAQEGLKYAQAGWYQPLDAYLNDPALTARDFDFADFQPATIQIETVNGQLIGMPVQLESEILFYRMDLFQEKGIEPPATFDDLAAAAQALHAPDKRLSGIGLRGKGAAATSMFSSFLYGFGGDWLDQNKNPTLTTPEAIAAFKYYGDLARNSGPRGAENNSWPENVALFQQGSLAMFVDASVFKVNVEDPSKSQVAGKVGYAVLPKGPVAQDPASFVWGISISSQSKHKEAAWYFIQWATSKPQTLELLKRGIPVARTSTWSDPSYTAESNKQFDQVQQQSIALSKHTYNPPVVSVAEVRDAIGPVIIAAIQGKDVAGAAKKANNDVKNIIATSG
ncbi:MAG: sugar ABC transporter substrate-binding protein [Chloroflexota bacterium]|nr:sugar ABC transporter substrate-binding protein [Chloroflexota bacterium]